MRVSIPFDVLLGGLFSLLLVSKLSLVQGQACGSSVVSCDDNGSPDDALCASQEQCTKCDNATLTCQFPKCDEPCLTPITSLECTANTDGCTQCWDDDPSDASIPPYCTEPFCGDECPPGPDGDAICAGNIICKKCLQNDDDGGWYCSEPPQDIPSSSPSSIPSSSPSGIPSQKPIAPTKKKTKKTKTGKKKAKMPTVQKKKSRKAKK